MNNLNLGLTGNGAVSALIDSRGAIVWSCFPRFDGDPLFCHLLQPEGHAEGRGAFSIEMVNYSRAEQFYETNTAILVTRLFDAQGGCLEVTDFAPRFRLYGRMFHPVMLVRRVCRISGTPRMAVRIHPLFHYGEQEPEVTFGSHHIGFSGPELKIRLTTDASIHAILENRPVFVDDTVTFVLGEDETLHEAVSAVGTRFLEETKKYWHEWVRGLSVPAEWQDEVIRAAITLQMNAVEDTGAIVAAMTTSIPEHADSGRNWDYRYCWLRDGYFVVNALNRLGATSTMEKYLGYILNVAAGEEHGLLQPVYGISGEEWLDERHAPQLAGYRGMGPVRVGNLAYEQIQHDVYGSAILSATHMFFDHRLYRRGDLGLFQRLEPLGQKAIEHFDQPDAGIWELRGKQRVHTYSSVMCWAACDRLSRIAKQLKQTEREHYWREEADRIHKVICCEAWSDTRQAFTAAWGEDALDASMLLLHEFDFLPATDPRFVSTVAAIESELKHGDFIYRYAERDDFGEPDNAFVVCTFWYVYALQALGRKDEARRTFETLLACCSPLGLLAEDYCSATREQWGNFVQTYSMVGLVNCALRLSCRWDQMC
ncbi:glycoside hydrolase family 15 protein [Formivibrio citricus]|nr:glycoside hydrolase family 15 protein [Formivibrio citricus]